MHITVKDGSSSFAVDIDGQPASWPSSSSSAAAATPPPPGSVLVRCKLTSACGPATPISITMPVPDRLATVKQFRAELQRKLQQMLRSAGNIGFKVDTAALKWAGALCDDAQQLEYYLPSHQPVVFQCTASVQVPHKTVADLKAAIWQKTGVPADKQLLVCGGRLLQDTDAVPSKHLPASSAVMLLHPDSAIDVCIEHQASKEKVTVKAVRSDTISKLKQLLPVKYSQAASGSCTAQLTLELDGRHLDNASTLHECGIIPGMPITLYTAQDMQQRLQQRLQQMEKPSAAGAAPAMKGCGPPTMQFADVANTSSMKNTPWSTSAPAWRKAAHGLCVEGKCDNRACAAYDKMVISNQRMGTFDLMLERDKCKCPKCDQRVVPVTCAFNNCQWRFTGVKVVDGMTMPMVAGDWKTAGDHYERFDDASSNQVAWSRLLISTRAPPVAAEECPICSDEMLPEEGDMLTTTACGHRFHQECLLHWTRTKAAPTCPCCRSKLPAGNTPNAGVAAAGPRAADKR